MRYRCLVFEAVDSVHVNLRRTFLLGIICLGEKELRQGDLLLSAIHACVWTFRGTRKEIRFQSREIFGISAFASLGTVIEINEEGQISNAAIIVAYFLPEDPESVSRKTRLFDGLRRADLRHKQERCERNE